VEGPFGDEPPVEQGTQPLHVKILLNLSPVKPQESVLKPEDVSALDTARHHARARRQQHGSGGFQPVRAEDHSTGTKPSRSILLRWANPYNRLRQGQ